MFDRIVKCEAQNFISGDALISAEEKHISTKQPTHWHDYFEIEYIIDGEGEYVLNGISYEIKPGVCFLSTPTDFHKIIFTRETHLINISFIPLLIDPDIYPSINSPIVLEDNLSDNILPILKKIVSPRISAKFRFNYLKHKLNELIIILSEKGNYETNPSGKLDDYIINTLLYVNQHFLEDLKLETLSKNVNLSSEHLSRKFHEKLGITIIQYITNLRLSYAKTLVTATNISFKEIYIKSGFNSHTHFSRAFKIKYGCTPSQLRSKNKTL